MQRKLGIAVEDRAPLPEDKAKRERIVLLKRNDDEYYPYYIIRAPDESSAPPGQRLRSTSLEKKCRNTLLMVALIIKGDGLRGDGLRGEW